MKPHQTIKQALVTGGAKGIGLAISENLARAGWNLLLCGRDARALEQAQQRLEKEYSVQVQVAVVDLSDESQVQRLCDGWKKEGAIPQAVICNAGDYGALGALHEVNFKEWKKSFDLNFFSIANLLHGYIGLAVQADPSVRKKIVIMSGSGLGSSKVHAGVSAYACAKSALYRLTETVHEEVYAQGIDINCIAPGFVKTGITAQAARAGSATLGDLADLSQKVLNEGGGTSPDVVATMIVDLLAPALSGVSGRLLSAKWDRKILDSPEKVAQMQKDPDFFRLRRIDGELFSKN